METVAQRIMALLSIKDLLLLHRRGKARRQINEDSIAGPRTGLFHNADAIEQLELVGVDVGPKCLLLRVFGQ